MNFLCALATSAFIKFLRDKWWLKSERLIWASIGWSLMLFSKVVSHSTDKVSETAKECQNNQPDKKAMSTISSITPTSSLSNLYPAPASTDPTGASAPGQSVHKGHHHHKAAATSAASSSATTSSPSSTSPTNNVSSGSGVDSDGDHDGDTGDGKLNVTA
jgi:hypothetical protein